MPRIRDFKTSFNAGELSTAAAARSDISPYKNGAAKLTNWRQLVQGGITRRPGTSLLETLTYGIDYQLEKFIFDNNQQYLFIFSDQKLEILSTTTDAIVTTLSSQPWTASMIGDLYIANEGDVTIVMHEDLETIVITRTGASTFTSSVFTYEFDSTSPIPLKYIPFYKHADQTITLTPSGTTGSITLTLSAAYWDAAHAGLYVRYKGKQMKITSITSTTVANATVIETLPTTTASTDWDEEAFSSLNGYPICGMFHDQRLHFMGSKTLPRNTWSSNIGAFYKFDTGTGLDSESIQGSISESNIGQIVAVSGLKQLQIFADRGELFIPTSEARPLTPANLTYKMQSRYGCRVRHIADFDNSTLYISSNGYVREFIFDDLQSSFSSFPLVYLSDHLVKNPTRITAQLEGFESQEQYAFVVNSDDGTLAVLLNERNEKITAWSEWTTQGTYKDCMVVGSSVYVIVDRVINSVNKTFIEKFDLTNLLDCSTKQTSASEKSLWTGLTDYANQEVYVVSGNYYIGKYTIDGSGNLDLSPVSVDSIEVGLNFTPYVKTLPPEIQLQDGPTSGEPRRIVKAVVSLDNTVDITVSGNKLVIREVNEDLSLEPSPFTGLKEFWMRGWDRYGQIEMQQDVPLPVTIYSLNIEVEF